MLEIDLVMLCQVTGGEDHEYKVEKHVKLLMKGEEDNVQWGLVVWWNGLILHFYHCVIEIFHVKLCNLTHPSNFHICLSSAVSWVWSLSQKAQGRGHLGR